MTGLFCFALTVDEFQGRVKNILGELQSEEGWSNEWNEKTQDDRTPCPIYTPGVLRILVDRVQVYDSSRRYRPVLVVCPPPRLIMPRPGEPTGSIHSTGSSEPCDRVTITSDFVGVSNPCRVVQICQRRST